ncbi:hypothetical protein L1887_58900 [Cichorium endivia]|nr:hypothetical protein L1887_58900 [Cichorium endivia]
MSEVPARSVHWDRSRLYNDEDALVVVSVDDLDGLVGDGRFVTVDAVADLVSVANDLVNVSLLAVDGADALVDGPDVVLLGAVAEFGGHDLDELAPEPAQLGVRLELVPVRLRLAKAILERGYARRARHAVVIATHRAGAGSRDASSSSRDRCDAETESEGAWTRTLLLARIAKLTSSNRNFLGRRVTHASRVPGVALLHLASTIVLHLTRSTPGISVSTKPAQRKGRCRMMDYKYSRDIKVRCECDSKKEGTTCDQMVSRVQSKRRFREGDPAGRFKCPS